MLSALSPQGPVDVAAGTPEAIQVLRGAIWVDALDPSADEARAVEEALGIQLPTRVEAAEIEVSSRLYVEAGTAFMTATVMIATDSPYPETGPVTFAFRPDCLVTLRFADPRPFVTFRRRMARTPTAHATAQKLFVALVDEIVDRVADILEAVGGELNTVSRSVFAAGDQGRLDYTTILARIGHTGELAANARESLVTLGRAIGFAVEALPNLGPHEGIDEHWSTVAKDVAALTDHATYLSDKVNFSLDATLGHVSTDQNKIIKMFSVLAVIFLPPTLIASIYGMNFKYIPELEWVAGYPFSLLLMLASAFLPYALFKYKRWL